MGKLVKCNVKGPKGLWHEGVHYADGDEVKLQESTVASKTARGNLYAKGEYAGKLAAAKAKQEAYEEELEERRTAATGEPEPEPEPEKGSDSKES